MIVGISFADLEFRGFGRNLSGIGRTMAVVGAADVFRVPVVSVDPVPARAYPRFPKRS